MAGLIDRKRARQAFQDYTDRYDSSDIKIRLKVEHTYRVAEIARRIAASLHLDEEAVDYAWLLGLLHDVGRFEQVRRFGTFVDKDSVDHAQLGADILFKDGLIRQFVSETALSAEQMAVAETAIRLHNKLTLPDALEKETQLYTDLLRDADKVDIFHVIAEIPYEDRMGRAATDGMEEARASVMQCVLEHRCVPRLFERTKFEVMVSQCCMAFELVYPESIAITKEQGYLQRLLAGQIPGSSAPWTDREQAQLAILQREIDKEWALRS